MNTHEFQNSSVHFRFVKKGDVVIRRFSLLTHAASCDARAPINVLLPLKMASSISYMVAATKTARNGGNNEQQ